MTPPAPKDERTEFIENTLDLWSRAPEMTTAKLIGMIYDDFQREMRTRSVPPDAATVAQWAKELFEEAGRSRGEEWDWDSYDPEVVYHEHIREQWLAVAIKALSLHAQAVDAAVRAEQDRHAGAIADRDGHGRCHACIELVRARGPQEGVV
jgi:hypothetical protein